MLKEISSLVHYQIRHFEPPLLAQILSGAQQAALGMLLSVVAATSCSPIPLNIQNKLTESQLQAVQARYQNCFPTDIHLNASSKTLTVTKASKNAEGKWYGDHTGAAFPIGSTFAAYLDQTQQVVSRARTGAPARFTASLVSADLSYSWRGILNSYMDWVDLGLTITTTDEKGNHKTVTLRRAVSVSAEEATSREFALSKALTALVLEYWDAVLQGRCT